MWWILGKVGLADLFSCNILPTKNSDPRPLLKPEPPTSNRHAVKRDRDGGGDTFLWKHSHFRAPHPYEDSVVKPKVVETTFQF